MTRKVALAAAVALGCLAVPASAPAAERLVATVERPSEIRSWKGIGAFSVYDATANSYRLAVTHVGGAPQLVPVAPRPVPFDADVGPDTNGEAAIVYSRCEREGPARRDCDIYRYSLARDVEAKVSNADSDSASEFSPTIWKGRVAWARTYDRRADTPHVYTRKLTAPRARRSQRLPGVPTRRSGNPTSERAVEGLELYGRWLALNVRYSHAGAGGICGLKEVRLVTLDGAARAIADQLCGLGGQSYAGLSFDDGRLYWARHCAGDPGGCGTANSGAFRYALSTGDYGLAGFVRELTGFSYVDDNRVYEVRGGAECGMPIAGAVQRLPPCQVVYTAPLSFGSTKPPRRS